MLYFILSLITFMGSISWTPIKNDNTFAISQYVLHSSFLSDYGNDALIRRFINLNSDIFSGGCKVLLPKGATIVRMPDNLRLLKEDVNIPGYSWYAALYTKGQLKNQWERMKGKVYSSLGIKQLSDITKEDIKSITKKDPKLAFSLHKKTAAEIRISYAPPNGGKVIELPKSIDEHKTYISYIVIETNNGDYKVLPVILRLSPIQKVENYMLRNRGGE